MRSDVVRGGGERHSPGGLRVTALRRLRALHGRGLPVTPADAAVRARLCALLLVLPMLLLLAAPLALTGCAAPPLTSAAAAEIGYEALGPFMQYEDKFLMAWAPGAAARQPEAARQLADELTRVIGDGARRPVFVAVSSDDSAFAARLVREACAQAPGALPNLRLVFIGQPADAEEARSAVLARRGTFYFEPPPK